MASYSFTVRKRDCEVSLTTDDRNAIEQQIAIWVMALSRKPLVETFAPEENPFVPESISEEIEEQVMDVVQETEEASEPDVKPFIPEKIEVSEEQKVQDYVEEFINTVEPQTIIDEPQVLQSELVEEIKPAELPSVKPEPIVPPLNPEVAVTLNSLFNAETPTSADFESILEKSVDNLNSDSSNVIKKDENFCKLVKANNITDRLELLLFTADYFCKYDARFVFSLKQINGKLMHNLAVIVDHGILKIALDNNYLERVGDSEYRLTEYGRSEIYSKAGIWS